MLGTLPIFTSLHSLAHGYAFSMNRGIEAALKKHASGGASASSSGAFAGKGHRLDGGAAPIDITGDAKRAVDNATNAVAGGLANVDPQVKILAGLVGLYAVFWWLS